MKKEIVSAQVPGTQTSREVSASDATMQCTLSVTTIL